MKDTYSLYEAKARLSAIVRRVREGRSAVITVHGKPVAEIRPIATPLAGVAGRVADLVDRGAIVPRKSGPARLSRVVRKPGALDRFLSERE